MDISEEERLVQEVLQENPPDERGVRPEWEAKVGWHRKENLRGGRQHQPRQDLVSDAKGDAGGELSITSNIQPNQGGERSHTVKIDRGNVTRREAVLIISSLTMLIIVAWASVRRKKTKRRTN